MKSKACLLCFWIGSVYTSIKIFSFYACNQTYKFCMQLLNPADTHKDKVKYMRKALFWIQVFWCLIKVCSFYSCEQY